MSCISFPSISRLGRFLSHPVLNGFFSTELTFSLDRGILMITKLAFPQLCKSFSSKISCLTHSLPISRVFSEAGSYLSLYWIGSTDRHLFCISYRIASAAVSISPVVYWRSDVRISFSIGLGIFGAYPLKYFSTSFRFHFSCNASCIARSMNPGFNIFVFLQHFFKRLSFLRFRGFRLSTSPV